MASYIARRKFLAALGGAAAAWPLAARAQQPERVRRIGVLLPAAADDLEFQTRVGAFLQGLQELRWTIGRNVRVDTRWATSNADSIRKHAAELAALARLRARRERPRGRRAAEQRDELAPSHICLLPHISIIPSSAPGSAGREQRDEQDRRSQDHQRDYDPS